MADETQKEMYGMKIFQDEPVFIEEQTFNGWTLYQYVPHKQLEVSTWIIAENISDKETALLIADTLTKRFMGVSISLLEYMRYRDKPQKAKGEW